MEVWKIIFLSEWVICRFHVNLPECTWFSSKFWSELNSTCRNWGHFFSNHLVQRLGGSEKNTWAIRAHANMRWCLFSQKPSSTIWGFVPRFWGEILNIKDTILYYFILHFIQYSTACWAWILRKPPFALLSPNVSRNSGVWITCHGQVNTCLLELEGFPWFPTCLGGWNYPTKSLRLSKSEEHLLQMHIVVSFLRILKQNTRIPMLETPWPS